MHPRSERYWHFAAGVALVLGTVYLHWRVAQSFNPDAPVFSAFVIVAELLAFVGLGLFYFDIWAEGDTPMQRPPTKAKDIGIDGDRTVSIDILITTFDEPTEVVAPSIEDAMSVFAPSGCFVQVHLLDDGARPAMQDLCLNYGIQYHARDDNRGFKAGNLREALLSTNGDFLVICDADTRLFPSILTNTLGYFRDPKVSWVQTPHWFYDLPEGRHPARTWLRLGPRLGRFLTALHQTIAGRRRTNPDPFMNDPDFFFDVIQRRRNRNNASFCCGAGSIHRREALLEVALSDHSEHLARLEMRLQKHGLRTAKALLRPFEAKPFEFHVSEDLFTSIRHHRRGWTSVYHPQVEARMLSPRTISSWSLQRMKYAGGTYDIMTRANPLWMRGVPWRTKLHYASTFWSYLSVLWVPILLLSPAVSLLTGWSPVKAYSLEFFQHLVPFLIAHEIAVMCASKGRDINLGRSMMIGLLPMHLKAGWNILRGRKPNFIPTPKIPAAKEGAHLLYPHLSLLVVFGIAAVFGLIQSQRNIEGYSTAFVATNLLWLAWNTSLVWRTARIFFWKDRSSLPLKRATYHAHSKSTAVEPQ